MAMIKRGTTKNAIVGVIKDSEKSICCPKCKKCFNSESEARNCSDKNCPLK